MRHKNFRAIYTNRDENFYGELHSLSRNISGWPKNPSDRIIRAGNNN